MTPLSEQKKKSLDSFLQSVNLVDLYQQYRWRQDRWSDGFYDIFRLVKSVIKAVKSKQLSRNHIIDVALWGRLRNIPRIKCLKDPIFLPLYEGDQKSSIVQNDPIIPVKMISNQTIGIGPTYISKLLRFAMPSMYGAIDTRLVQVFGCGDHQVSRLPLLMLKVQQGQNGGGAIGRDNWLIEYGNWLSILHYISDVMNNSGMPCPHPKQFVAEGLREQGQWIAADVEMALFSYASKEINR